MKTKIEKEVKYLKVYAVTTLLVFFFLMLSSFISQNKNKKFDEIDVERINIIETDGSLKMVISNEARQHPGIVDGKIIERKYPRPPGIIFFNQIGDEMGGLVFGENGENGHFGSFTWDKFKGDQTIGFRHLEGDNGKYSSGLHIWQQPNISGAIINSKIDSINSIENPDARKEAFKKMKDNNLLANSRLFIGKSRNDASMIILNDKDGQERIIIKVDASGNPKLEFLNDRGEIYYSIPE